MKPELEIKVSAEQEDEFVRDGSAFKIFKHFDALIRVKKELLTASYKLLEQQTVELGLAVYTKEFEADMFASEWIARLSISFDRFETALLKGVRNPNTITAFSY